MQKSHLRFGGLLLAILTLIAVLAPTGVTPVRANAGDLFISEYIEGSSSNKALEIYNGTGAAVNLSGYFVDLYTNGSSSIQVTLTLGGTLANGDVYVIGNALASAPITTVADTASTVTNFNGDDAVVLRKGSTDLDVIGQVGFDPGVNWVVSTGATSEFTLVRKSNICAGDTNRSNAFNGNNEWDVFPQDTFSNLGSHTANCSVGDVAPTVTSTSPTNNAANVAVGSNVVINFSEAVNVVGAIDFTCGITPVTFTPSGSTNITSLTLDPDSNLPGNSNCSVTLDITDIVDVDGTPNNLTSPFILSFMTETPLVCGTSTDKIYEIQDNGAKYNVGGTFTVDGVVIGDYQATGQWDGFYIQDPVGDGNASTSDGIYIFDPSPLLAEVAVGQYVRVTGTLGEFAANFSSYPVATASTTETQLSATSVQICGNTATVTPTTINLPFATIDEQENYEGMLVTFPQTLTVTELFTLGRYSEVSVSTARLFNPTNVVAPGSAAVAMQDLNNRSRILIDDGSKLQNPATIPYPPPGLTASNTLRHGDAVSDITGVFSQSNSRFGNGTSTNTNPFRYRVHPTTMPTFTSVNTRPTNPPSVGNSTLRVTSMNLLNYFNTFTNCYQSGGYSAGNCRGADDSTEFTRQRNKTIEAIIKINPDVLLINELENDIPNDNGNGATTAIEDLVNGLNAASAPGTYAFINTGRIGTDAIRVGIIYKPASVTPVGTTAILSNVAPFNVNTRPPIAQAFSQNANNEVFIIIPNHFKSKGSCPASGSNADQGDGQGCWNPDRLLAAQQLINWLATNPTGTGDTDILIMGDLNAYAKEDPITYLTTTAGYTNLIETYVGPGNVAYSYVFDGQSGYLDHALASPSIVDQVTGAAEYHINADEPTAIDYNTDFKTAAQITSLYAADEFRVSDHDPVIVGLQLDSTPPGNFSLTSPTDGQNFATTNIPDPFTFTWTASANATGYIFYLEKDGVATPIVNTTVAGTSYTLSAAERSQITTGQYFWAVTATDGTPNDNLTRDAGFTVSTATAPGTFALQTPANNATFTDLSTDIALTWGVSANATTYTLSFTDTTNTTVDIDNLTPAADTDALTCDANVCTYTLDNSTYVTANGQYTWAVAAVNAAGTTGASNNARTFFVNVPAPTVFNLLTPTNNSSFNAGADITSFTWEVAAGADLYTLTVNRPSLTPYVLANQTPAADTDAVTCNATTCTATVDGAAQFTATGSYTWSVAASNIGGTTNSTTSFTFVIAVLPQSFSLVAPANGSNYNSIATNIVLTWGVSENATTYTLTLDRPTSSDLVLPGLTPLTDSDGLTCDATSCNYTINNSTQITENGTYTWLVTATLGSNNVAASNNPFTFVVDVPAPSGFTLLTPANASVINIPSSVTSFTWNESTGATSYNLLIDRPTLADYMVMGTAAADADQITCSNGVCSATINGGTELAVEGLYSWNVTATGFGGTTNATAFTFSVDLLPQAFTLTSPVNNAFLNNVSTLAFTWAASTNATSYTLTVNRVGNATPVITAVVTTCTTTCTYTTNATDQAALTEGNYTWTVTATDGTNNVTASNAPLSFTVNFPPQAFTLLSPTDGSAIADKSTLNFTWTASTNATNYTLTVNPAAGGGALFSANITNCVTSTCSYTPNTTQLNTLTAGSSYTWTVSASDGTTSVAASNAPFDFTITAALPPLFRNGSFEVVDDVDTTQPENWNIATVSSDLRVCAQTDAPDGVCVYRFTGSTGENSRIQQANDVTAYNVVAGDTITVTFQARSNGAPDLRVRMILVYTDDTNTFARAVVRTPSTTYQPGTVSIIAEKPVKLVRIQVTNFSTSGRVFVDDFEVVITDGGAGLDAGSGGDLIPLPSVPSN